MKYLLHIIYNILHFISFILAFVLINLISLFLFFWEFKWANHYELIYKKDTKYVYVSPIFNLEYKTPFHIIIGKHL